MKLKLDDPMRYIELLSSEDRKKFAKDSWMAWVNGTPLPKSNLPKAVEDAIAYRIQCFFEEGQ